MIEGNVSSIKKYFKLENEITPKPYLLLKLCGFYDFVQYFLMVFKGNSLVITSEIFFSGASLRAI